MWRLPCLLSVTTMKFSLLHLYHTVVHAVSSCVRQWHRLVVLVVVGAGVYLTYQLALRRVALHSLQSHLHFLNEDYSVWPPFIAKPKRSQPWYATQCLDGQYLDSLEGFLNSVSAWSESPNPECAELYDKFTTLYEVTHRYSRKIHLPPAFAQRIRQSLNGDEAAFEKIQSQHLVHVYNLLTSEHVGYNPVRARRPGTQRTGDLFQWVDRVAAETQKNCDFCNYETMTAVDELGRHQLPETVRMTNTYKLEAWHSMVITRNTHHPLNLTQHTFMALFKEATQWFFDVSVKDPHYVYPNWAWDTLPHAGASQVHPHVQLLMAPNHYYGSQELLRQAAQRYHLLKGDNYFTALLEVHAVLGLVVQYGDAVALATLTGKGELEVLFLSDYPGHHFFRLIYFTTQAYHHTFSQPCKSLAGVLPALSTGVDASRGRLPALARLVARGDCTSLMSDVSSFELFQGGLLSSSSSSSSSWFYVLPFPSMGLDGI